MAHPAPSHPPVHNLVAIAAGVLLTIAGGGVYGKLSQRWGAPPDLTAAARHLDEFPVELGDWQATADLPVRDGVLEMLQSAGYVNRRYVNRRTGESIGLAIFVGPPGPTAVHTPEVCYSSRAFRIEGPRERTVLEDRDGRLHSFWRVRFQADDAAADHLSVYYAWSVDRAWQASEAPRFEFAGSPMLRKLQLAGTMRRTARDGSQDPCRDFLEALLASSWSVEPQQP